MRALYCLALVSLCSMSCAHAQDPTKAAPGQYTRGPENEHVKIVYIHYGPHARSPMHEHPAGVVVSITDARLRFTGPDGATHEVSALRGEALYYPPTKHAVENLTDAPYNGVFIEIKSGRGQGAGLRKHGVHAEDQVMQALLPASTIDKASRRGSGTPEAKLGAPPTP